MIGTGVVVFDYLESVLEYCQILIRRSEKKRSTMNDGYGNRFSIKLDVISSTVQLHDNLCLRSDSVIMVSPGKDESLSMYWYHVL